MRLFPFSMVMILIAVFVSPGVWAITDEEIFRQLRFNFINPGARALGLGGAFIAVADDATAAQANPAGLVQISTGEFFAEVRHIDSDESTTTGDLLVVGAEGNLIYSSRNERRPVTTPTFVSYVFPLRTVTVGFSRQEVMRTRVDTTTSMVFPPESDLTTTWEGRGGAALELTQWNATVAWRAAPWISLGGTASLGRFRLDGSVENTILDPDGFLLCDWFGPDAIATVDFDGDGIATCEENPALEARHAWYSTRMDDDDIDVTFSAGILITPRENYSIGLVYRGDPEFEFVREREVGILELDDAPGSTRISRQTLHLPSQYGLGFKWRAGLWTVAADAVRVNYSNLVDGLVSQENLITSWFFGSRAEYTADDVTEFHVGVERYFTRGGVQALRFGASTDPDNSVRDTSGTFGAALQGRDDEVHYNVGLGFVFQEKLQLDIAISLSSLGNEAVASTIYRF